jgi:hypothetical protein
MIEKLKELFFVIIPLSLVATYIGCMSFYLNYNLDITTYIRFEDLTLVYSKFTIIVILYTYMVFYVVKHIFSDEREENWWDKTIGKTLLKRRAIPLFIATIAGIVLMLIFDIVFSLTALLIILLIAIYLIFYVLKTLVAPTSTDLIFRPKSILAIVCALAYSLLFIPAIVGGIYYKHYKPEKAIIYFESKEVVNTVVDQKLILVGKNLNFIFIYNNSDNTTSVYPVDKVEKIVYPSK